MSFRLSKSRFDPTIFEIYENEIIADEIRIAFPVKKIPFAFDSLEEIHQWVQETESKLAWHSACASLAIRNHASQQLKAKLERKGFSSDVIEKTTAKLVDMGLIKDDEWIFALIEKELRSGHGPRYIEAKLRSQGIPFSEGRKMVTKERQQEAIERLIKKKGSMDKAALLRRGFDFQ